MEELLRDLRRMIEGHDGRPPCAVVVERERSGLRAYPVEGDDDFWLEKRSARRPVDHARMQARLLAAGRITELPIADTDEAKIAAIEELARGVRLNRPFPL